MDSKTEFLSKIKLLISLESFKNINFIFKDKTDYTISIKSGDSIRLGDVSVFFKMRKSETSVREISPAFSFCLSFEKNSDLLGIKKLFLVDLEKCLNKFEPTKIK